jgi:MoxR-like ATPase
MDATEAMEVPAATEECQAILDAVGEAVIADRGFFEDVLLGILSRGHVLLEDVPGTGKTLTARSLASALGLSFSRIQFTPDLLPSDVTGTHVFNEGTREFEFNEGPIFANVVLADEINRAPPKTQAALLEAMEERQVTTDGETRALPEPFFVIATQNPVEQEGSLHPDETLLMNGDLWTASEALAYAKEHGEIVHDGDTRLYDAGTTTQTLDEYGDMIEQECMVYETSYDGRLYTVETKTGRRIRVSGNHPFLVNRAGTLQWVEARDLDDDDHLVAPERLDAPERPFPSHTDALGDLEDDHRVVRSDEVRDLRRRLEGDGELDLDDVDALRIAAGLSKKALAERVDASYDQVLNYLQGADIEIGDQLVAALSAVDIPDGDAVEAHTVHRFEGELTDAEAGFFVGFVLSDGHVTDESVRIYQKNYPDRFERWVGLAEKLGFEPRLREIHGGREAAIDATPLVEYLDARYDLRSPTSLLSAPEPFRREFLEMFLVAEGHFDGERHRLTFTQADRETTNLVAHLLLQFGIRPWIADRDRVYRLKVQGEDVARYVEQFEWPGETPDVEAFDSAHRVTPLDAEALETVVDRLGLEYDGLSDREWYASYSMLRTERDRMAETHLERFLDDVETELETRRTGDPEALAREDLGAAAKQCGLAMTDIVDGTDLTKRAVWQAYKGAEPPAEAVEFVADAYSERVGEAEELTAHLRRLADGEVFYDRVTTIESEPYDGTVIGLSVPRTHNYVAGLGACGVNHNTFPLPEAQVDRFVVKTNIGYPDEDGEVELLRRRSGRVEQSPSVEPLLDEQRVTSLQQVPETIRVDDDLLSYIAAVARATREDHRVEVGVSPRGTQRLFESARSRAVLEGREYVTPDDVKHVAQPVLAHRLVLTPDATVNNVAKRDVVAEVLDQIPVPTVE